MRVVWQCEQDEFCRKVLAKHWPGVPCHPDVRALVADTDCERLRPAAVLGQDPHGLDHGGDEPLPGGRVVPVPVPYVDVLCGGFPCQDISVAGRGEGIDGARSGLWGEYARLIRDLRPRYVIVENVAALLARGMERVLGDLAACGYDAEWDCIPASAVGAPHRRDRVWLVAYPQRPGLEGHGGDAGQPEVAEPRDGRALADAAGRGRGSARPVRPAETGGAGPLGEPARSGWWELEPDVGRVAHGIPSRVDRLRALGNALVPQIAEWLGRRILDAEGLT
jgi:DNA (cytosine-5)-methyltransferase 1